MAWLWSSEEGQGIYEQDDKGAASPRVPSFSFPAAAVPMALHLRFFIRI